ncbi:hypothetical protein ACFWMQ_06175 [Streptomyces sp. NPDC058372]|uniref:hypothetical protein n=1 Tax=Streptomyces sp. NPDC058372 TaxID=3346464 RepID=UPI003661ED28
MKKVAEYLRTQAASLTAMADADNLKGKYADELAENARGLGRKLDLAEDRYREVKGHLSGWAEDLEEFQKRADRALRDAKDAQRTIDAHESRAEDPPRPSDGKSAEKPADTGKEDPRLKQAKEDLHDARTRLDTAEGDYEERADHVARKIRSSIDDDMKDSVWNDFKGWVADAEWLSKFADWAGWATTVLGLVAMVFPFVGGVVAALTLAAFLVHLVQAAIGNGSWYDVVMDIGAFKLARVGTKAADKIKSLQQGSRNTAADLAKDRAKAQASSANKGARDSAAKRERKRGGTSGSKRNKARASRLNMERKNRAAGHDAAEEVRNADLPDITRGEKREALLDKAMGQQMKDIRNLRDMHPDNAALAANARKAEGLLLVHQGAWGVSTVADLGDKAIDSQFEQYGAWKDGMTAPMAGTSQW